MGEIDKGSAHGAFEQENPDKVERIDLTAGSPNLVHWRPPRNAKTLKGARILPNGRVLKSINKEPDQTPDDQDEHGEA